MSDENIIELAGKRPPVIYSIHVTETWKGDMTFEVEGVAADPRSKTAVACTLIDVAGILDPWIARVLKKKFRGKTHP